MRLINQVQVTSLHQIHVTCKNHIYYQNIYTTRVPMATKIGWMATYLDGLLLISHMAF